MKNDYLFGISLIKVFEKNMLTYDDFLILSSKSYTDAVQSLIKRGYLRADKSPENSILEKEFRILRKLEELKITIPGTFFLENDFVNIKAAAKAIYYGVKYKIPVKTPSSEKSRNLDEKYKKGYRDKYTDFLEASVRLLKSGTDCDEYIKDKLLETGLEISDNDYFRNWFRLIHSLKNRDTENENIKIAYLKSHRHNVFGIAPVFGYYYGMITELRNVRTVLSGKKAGATEKDIRERLCNTYV